MIDYDKLDKLMELPVSEEMLGAYMEGNLSKSELDNVAKLVSSNIQLSELFYDVSKNKIDEFESASHPWDVYEGNYGCWEVGLSPVLSLNGLSLDEEIDNIKEFRIDSDMFLDGETLYHQNEENSFSNDPLNLNVMANSSKTIIYGEASENIFDPVFVQQPDDHSCALRSQQIVLRDFGIDIPFKDLEQIALDNGVYTNEGTYTYDIGKVLQLAGVGMHQTVGNSVDDLINELVQGHRVIVSVDAYELWHNNTMGDKMLNWFQDAIGLQGGNHALIVAGVEIEPNHPENSKVILTDPGAGHLRIEYPMEQFKGAWGDSNCFMAATDDPAPYQYDVTTGMEVPSNFAVQQYVNDFVANNSYQLSPDMINIPHGYQPTFTGHLNVVGDLDYETFKSDYDLLVASRLPSSLSVKEQIEEVAKLAEEHESHRNNNENSIMNTSSHCNNEHTGNQTELNHGSSLSEGEEECDSEDDECWNDDYYTDDDDCYENNDSDDDYEDNEGDYDE